MQPTGACTSPDGTPPPEDFDKPHVVFRWVRDKCNWPMREKMAYLMLYSRRGMDGHDPYPGLRKLANDMGSNRNSALVAVRALQGLGALTIEPRRIDGGEEWNTNLYRLRPPWLACQSMAKKPRGLRRPVSEQVDTNCDEVTSNTGQGDFNPARPAGTLCGRNKPRQAAKESPLIPATKPARKKSASPTVADDSEATQKIVARFHELMREQALPGVTDWAVTRRIAANVIRGGRGAPPIPWQDALEALAWGVSDDYWRKRLVSGGLPVLRGIWAAWRERSVMAHPVRRQRVFEDIAGDGPRFKADSPWGQG